MEKKVPQTKNVSLRGMFIQIFTFQEILVVFGDFLNIQGGIEISLSFFYSATQFFL